MSGSSNLMVELMLMVEKAVSFDGPAALLGGCRLLSAGAQSHVATH